MRVATAAALIAAQWLATGLHQAHAPCGDSHPGHGPREGCPSARAAPGPRSPQTHRNDGASGVCPSCQYLAGANSLACSTPPAESEAALCIQSWPRLTTHVPLPLRAFHSRAPPLDRPSSNRFDA